jgi:hypothetical protein
MSNRPTLLGAFQLQDPLPELGNTLTSDHRQRERTEKSELHLTVVRGGEKGRARGRVPLSLALLFVNTSGGCEAHVNV